MSEQSCFEIAKQLSNMDVVYLFRCFPLDNEHILDDEVELIGC